MEHNLYYAVGPNCWGTGTTQEDAIKRARQNWPSYIKPRRPKPEHFSVWVTDAKEIEVSGFDGSFTVPAGCSSEKLQTSTLARG